MPKQPRRRRRDTRHPRTPRPATLDNSRGRLAPVEHLTARPRTARRINPLWYLPLLLPFIAMLAVPLYAGASPAVLGVPFFYWYQFAWVGITAALTAIVYRATTA